ncbi:hypothetical protein AAFM79_05475, partial [Trichormus azollae HNT15244]
SPPGQPPFLPQVPPSPTSRFRDGITASRASMPARPTRLLGLQSPPICGHPSVTTTYRSLHFNFNLTRVRAHHLPVLHLPFLCIYLNVITENYPVLEVLEGIRPERFGELMKAFHASLRDDYEVSVPALDILVGILQRTPGVFGARLTGAGFGRVCVTLVTSRPGREIATKLVDEYKYTGYNGKILVPTINL